MKPVFESQFSLHYFARGQIIRFNFAIGDGEVYIWDMKTKRCRHKFRDKGCLKGVCIDVSKDGRFIACGYVFCTVLHPFDSLIEIVESREGRNQVGIKCFSRSLHVDNGRKLPKPHFLNQSDVNKQRRQKKPVKTFLIFIYLHKCN